MFKVKNARVINKISYRTLKSGRVRNIIAVFAIILTSVMFTSLFTFGTSAVESFQQSTMRQVGTSAHGGFKFLTWEEYEKVASDKKVKDISYNIFIGVGENPELNKTLTEIRFTEEKAAKWSFSMPTEGRLPKDRLDIATTTQVLDALGVPHEKGAEVHLEFTVNGIKYSEDFTLCGWWENENVLGVNEVFLSREYCEQTVQVWNSEADRNSVYINGGSFAGSINPTLFFANSWDIEKQINELKQRCGFGDDINEGVNWAYMTQSVDVFSVVLFSVLIAVIILSGYLIIYNIFYISVNNDIRFYGLLKTIGTTNKQLKCIVKKQAFLLSGIGIPLGLTIGYALSSLIIPGVMQKVTTISHNIVSANPVIFLFSTIFTLVTVRISCIKPCKRVSRISPIEAVRYVSENHKKRKRSHKVTAFSMAVGNIGMTRKKTIVVVLSLSLSLVLLNTTVTFVNGFDMDKYIENIVVSDFYITDMSILDVFSPSTNFNSVTEDVREQVTSLPFVDETGSVYMMEYRHFPDDTSLQRAKDIYNEYADEFPANMKKQADENFNEGWISSHIYGVDGIAEDKMEILEGEFDKDKFASGNYVIVSTFTTTGEGHFYEIGDRVTLDLGNGAAHEYEVMALGNVPYALGPQHGHGVDVYFTIPSVQFISLTGEVGAMNIAFNTSPEDIPAAEEWVKNYCENTELDYRSKQFYVDEFEGMKNTYLFIGGALSFILMLIGILNFVNAVVSSIQARKKELAVLQSIGMTGTQVKKMLVYEGMCYVALTSLVALTVGNILVYAIVKTLLAQMWFFTYQFVIAPAVVAVTLMAIPAAVIPVICYGWMCRKSIVERLRETEM